MASGVERIRVERQRQKKRWTRKHDDEHAGNELAMAASAYIAPVTDPGSFGPGGTAPRGGVPIDWPWKDDDYKPSADPIRNLEKAGALIAAEIDRLQTEADRD